MDKIFERNPIKDCWIMTYSGKRYYYLSPTAEDISIVDIAHALSNKCRFAGHCKDFYSVAQHSFLVAEYCRQHWPNNKGIEL